VEEKPFLFSLRFTHYLSANRFDSIGEMRMMPGKDPLRGWSGSALPLRTLAVLGIGIWEFWPWLA